MKKIISLILTIGLMISSSVCVLAAGEEIAVYLEGYSGFNGEKVDFDIPPQIINDRTMVPIRAIFEAMGATVEWDDTTKTAISTKDGTTVKMALNSTVEYINGTAYNMDVPPVIIEGRTLTPARYVAEAFGYHVTWDESTKSVLIGKTTDYTISKVMDGSRQHPYRLGSTISFNFWYYDEANGNCTLTLNEFLTPEEMEDKFGRNIFTINNLSCITGHIKLNRYSLPDSCHEMIYSSEAVTSKLKPIGNYAWYNAYSSLLSYNIELYEGGETDIYISIHTENLSENETIDYFTITYRFGSNYDDKRTVWFTLK